MRAGHSGRSRLHPQHQPAEGDIMATEHTSGNKAVHIPDAEGIHLLVVIDHHEAKIYRTEMRGGVPQIVVPYDPHGHGKHLHSRNEETDGKRQPDRKSFYEAIVTTLRDADQILILGCGTGESSAMEQLIANLKHNHKDLAGHIAGSMVVDKGHRTEGELLAQAREFFASMSV
jgi:hypothetical protein